MAHDIKFGTDGWRAVIADGFTFANVRIIADAIGVAARDFPAPDHVDHNLLIVGYDRRFLSEEFAQEVALTLSKSGFDILLSSAPTPSQTISFSVKHRAALGGVVITASHNPATYNGVKFKGWYGGSALPEMYSAIASNLGKQNRRGGGSVTEVDLLEDYVAALREIVDVDVIRSSGLKIVHDPIYGASAHLVNRVLDPEGDGTDASSLKVLRGEINPSFGGVNPEPIPENLESTRRFMKRGGWNLAICNDGDADRLGVLDEKGDFVSPHKIIALLAIHLVRRKGVKGELVKTFSTTRLLEKIARSLNVPLHETAIGFKYVADLMLTRDIIIGGEESGGIGIGSFLPERDGILSGLLVAEIVAEMRKPLSRLIEEIEVEFGALHYGRRDVHRSMESCQRLIDRVMNGELNSLHENFASREEKDGVKLNFGDGTWILFRKSGTEPMLRIYCESPDESQVERMLDRAVEELDRS